MTRPIGEQPLKRFTGMLAGAYLYFDAFEGAPPQQVTVTYEYGECLARFVDAEPEDGEVVLPVRDLAGRFERA